MVNELNNVFEVEVSYRPKFKAQDRPKINTSSDVYRIFIEVWNKDKIQLQEEFKVMLLNRNNRVLGLQIFRKVV